MQGRALPLSAQDKSVKKFTFLTDREKEPCGSFSVLCVGYSIAIYFVSGTSGFASIFGIES